MPMYQIEIIDRSTGLTWNYSTYAKSNVGAAMRMARRLQLPGWKRERQGNDKLRVYIRDNGLMRCKVTWLSKHYQRLTDALPDTPL